MIDPEKKLIIVYASDNNFAPLLAASIKSVELNSPGIQKEIYVVSDGIKADNISKLRQSITSPEVNLHIVDVKTIVGDTMKMPTLYLKALPSTTFVRLFIENIVPTDAERVLYLDADMIVQEHLSKLMVTDLQGNIIGAIQDQGILTLGCSWGGGVKNYEELGFKSEDKYFNAGLLLIDLKKWKEFRVMEKSLEASVKYRKHMVYADQYCLNAVLATRWLELDPRWNHLVSNDEPGAFLIHFIGVKPIYEGYPYSEAYRKIFFGYLNQTEWKGMKLVTKGGQKLTFVKQFMKKIFG